MAEVHYDFSRICRSCKGESDDLKSVFEFSDVAAENPRIDEMLMACTAVQVKPEDGLPAMICSKCHDQLKSAYAFKRLCEESDTSLKEYVNSIKNVENSTAPIKQEGQTQDSPLDISASLDEILSEDGESPIEDHSLLSSDLIEFLDNNQMLLTCRICRKVFTTLEGLRSHKRIHLGTLFKCKYCGKGYTRQTHVYRHELSHGKHKLHVCRICNKTLTRMEHLKRHLTTHLKEKPFSCSSCNRGFNRSDHLDVHAVRCKGERVHICDICNRGFTREDSLQVHKRLHENQKPVLPTLDNIDNIEEHYYEIDHDPNADFSNSDLDDCFEPQVEMTENPEDDKDDLPNDEPLLTPKTDGEDEENLIKNEEQQILDDNKALLDRLVSMGTNEPPGETDSADSDYVPKKPPPKIKRGRGRPRKNPVKKARSVGRPRGRPPVKREPSLDLEVHEDELLDTEHDEKDEARGERRMRRKVHHCRICKREFSRYNHLSRHMNSHSVVKPYQCEVCHKRFTRRDHLQQHSRLHDKKPAHACESCGKTFSRTDQLAKHRASKHSGGEKDEMFDPPSSGDKKFECHVCMKSFTTEKYRDVHVKGHMGEKRYKCRTCDKCFLSKSHLTEHMKFHNEHSKKFLCSECGQRFIRNDYLVIHMRRHRGEKPFKCKFCGKGFPRTTDLTVHERYHTGEKTHLCTICGRGFGRAYNLTVHMRTHTGEKPYQCTYCDAAFAQGNDLKAHVRRHTGERFHCELCSESFLMGYLLTQHKRNVHGLNVVSNIRRLQPANKIKEDTDEPPPITIPLPKPVVPDMLLANLQAHPGTFLGHHMARE